jgi:hypothetical protein
MRDRKFHVLQKKGRHFGQAMEREIFDHFRFEAFHRLWQPESTPDRATIESDFQTTGIHGEECTACWLQPNAL